MSQNSENPSTVAEISDRAIEAYARLDPELAARIMGVGLNTSQLRDYSPAGSLALAEFFRDILRALQRAEVTGEADRLGRRYLSTWASGKLGLLENGEDERDLSVIGAPPATVRMSFDLFQPESLQDWERLALRMSKVPSAMAGYQTNLQRGLDRGNIGPRRCALAVAEQCEVWGGVSGPGWFSTFAEGQGEIPAAERLREAARSADAAYLQLAAFLRNEYAPRAMGPEGVGRDAYNVWAQEYIGGEVDIDATYSWGWDELERLEGQKAAECDRIRAGAGFAEIRHLLNTDPERAVHGVDAWRAWLQELSDQAVAELDGRQFDIAAPLRSCTVAIPPEGSAAAPYYTPPSDDLLHPGRIWFPTVGRTSFPTWDGPTTVFHEGVPGHHLQLGATRVLSLTRAQRLGFISAHGEGWALYAERFMDELGRFERPEFRLGFLSMQALRAARVVVDIGLHTGQTIPTGYPHGGEPWSFEAAVELLEEASGMTRSHCESEVLRYLSWPTQAISYKLGERAWLECRERARRRQGAGFDLKVWHGRALALGPLGLADLSEELDRLDGPR